MLTLAIVPPLMPAIGPILCELLFAVMVTLLSVRLLTLPPGPISPKSPAGELATLVRLLMVKPPPLNEPVKQVVPGQAASEVPWAIEAKPAGLHKSCAFESDGARSILLASV